MTPTQRAERTDYEIMLVRTLAAKRGASPLEVEKTVQALQGL